MLHEATHSLYRPDPKAIQVYEQMIDKMDDSGYVDMHACLEINLNAIEKLGDLGYLNTLAQDLVRASLVLPAEDSPGWIVRLPVAPQP